MLVVWHYSGGGSSHVEWTAHIRLHYSLFVLQVTISPVSQGALTRQVRTGPHGQHCDHCVHQLTRWSTLPSHVAIRPPPPPLESEVSEVALRNSHSGLAQPGSRRAVMSYTPWRVELHSQTVQLIWRHFGLAQVDLFESPESSNCQLFYSLTEGTLGREALTHSWLRGICKYLFPPVSLVAQTLCKIREDEEQILLVVQYSPTRTWFPELMHVTAPPWQIPLRKDLLTQRRGTLWQPHPDATLCLVPGRDVEVLGDLPQDLIDTITSARATYTRHAHSLKWNLFVKWYSSHREDPRNCPIRVEAVSLHPQCPCSCDCCQLRPRGREVGGET